MLLLIELNFGLPLYFLSHVFWLYSFFIVFFCIKYMFLLKYFICLIVFFLFLSYFLSGFPRITIYILTFQNLLQIYTILILVSYRKICSSLTLLCPLFVLLLLYILHVNMNNASIYCYNYYVIFLISLNKLREKKNKNIFIEFVILTFFFTIS